MVFAAKFSERQFDTVPVLLYDPVPANLNITRRMMYDLGFRNFEQTTEFHKLKDLVQRDTCDLLVAAVDGQVEPLSQLIREVRSGDLEANPFLVVIVTAWELRDDLVKDVINSGADDLIGRPFSVGGFRTRLSALIESRKRFVVTANYVGPDRRKKNRSTDDPNLIDVPNSFKAKVNKEPVSTVQARAAIDATQATITVEKMRRQAFKIGVLVSLLQDSLDESGAVASGGPLEPELQEILDFTEDLNKRVALSDFAHASDLCGALLNLARRMVTARENSTKIKSKDWALLQKLAIGIQIAFNPGQNVQSITSDIAAMIETHNLNLRQAS